MAKSVKIISKAIFYFALWCSVLPEQAVASPADLYITSASSELIMLISSSAMCLVYTYDANGNRISLSTFPLDASGATWGSSTFGCFNWTS